MAERRGQEVHREADTNDGGRKRWRRQWGRSEKMIEGFRDRGEQPPTGMGRGERYGDQG